jgi:hypothetical protein
VFLCALGSALFLYACGDLGMVLPSQGSYRVSARVTTPKDNFAQDGHSSTDKSKDDYTLDTYSIVNKNSEIQPYFVNSVANDPDVRGLTVFVQDYAGNTVSRKVRYQLESDEEENPPEESEEPPEETPNEALWEIPAGTEIPAEENPDEAAGEVSPEAPVSSATETVQAESPETGNNAWAGEPESPAEPPPELPGADFDAPAADYTADSPADTFGGTGGGQTGTETALPSAETEIEIVPAETVATPAETETAPVEIAEAAASPDEAETAEAETGAGDSGDVGEPGADAPGPDTTVPSLDTAAPAPPPVASPPVETPKAPIPEDQIVLVKQLDQYLPMFRITEDIEIGRYNLVFQVMGKGTDVILYRTFKPIYFLGDAKFTLEDIQSFLPMAVTTRGQLIPMGINVMLKTEIKADERLDPYVIWHNGKKILAQGRMSSGADYLFWKTPEKTGFHNIRAEVFPLLSGERVPGNMIGKIKELSLPVSSKSEGIQQFNESSGEFAGWYQFWGTLDDAKAADNVQRRLASLYAQPSRWIPFKEIYSLFVGRDDVYTLPGTPFKLAQGEQGTGRMYFHLAALSEGSILSIRFAPQEQPPRKSTDRQSVGETADGTAALDLFLAGDALILRIASEDASREKSLSLKGGEFITVELVFAIAPDRFDAELRLENPAETTGLLSVALAKPISGEGAIILGGGEKPAGYKKSAKLPVFGETETFGGGTMALNELAFSYDRVVPENEEDADSGISESLLSQEEEPGAEQEPSSLSAL